MSTVNPPGTVVNRISNWVPLVAVGVLENMSSCAREVNTAGNCSVTMIERVTDCCKHWNKLAVGPNAACSVGCGDATGTKLVPSNFIAAAGKTLNSALIGCGGTTPEA